MVDRGPLPPILAKLQPIAIFIFDCVVKLLGPALICLACGLIGYVSWVGFTVMIPLKAAPWTTMWFVYNIYGAYIVFNIVFNYFMCVMTNPGNSDSAVYKRLVREAESAGLLTQFDGYWDKSYVNGGVEADQQEEWRGAGGGGEGSDGSGGGGGGASSGGAASGLKQRRSQLNSGNPPVKDGGWMELEPGEWGFCKHSRLPKPPRSHYCHVSHRVVMNMDHYCPWMFNTVGYLNYRYFVMFIFNTWLGVTFVALECLGPFLNIMRLGLSEQARAGITFSFVISISVGIALSLFLVWHGYLVLSGQTTIEFWGNCTKWMRCVCARAHLLRRVAARSFSLSLSPSLSLSLSLSRSLSLPLRACLRPTV